MESLILFCLQVWKWIKLLFKIGNEMQNTLDLSKKNCQETDVKVEPSIKIKGDGNNISLDSIIGQQKSINIVNERTNCYR